MPAKAGIQTANVSLTLLDSGLRRNDGKNAEESCQSGDELFLAELATQSAAALPVPVVGIMQSGRFVMAAMGMLLQTNRLFGCGFIRNWVSDYAARWDKVMPGCTPLRWTFIIASTPGGSAGFALS